MTPKKPARRAPQALAAKPVAGKPVAAKPVAAKPTAPASPAVAEAAAVAKASAHAASATRSEPKFEAAKFEAAKSAAAKSAAAKTSPAKSSPAKPSPAGRSPAPVTRSTPVPAEKTAPPVAVAPPAAPIAAGPAPAPAPLRRIATPPVEHGPAFKAAPVPVVDVASLASAVAAAIPPEALPKAVRGVAGTGLAQARDAYATLKHSAETLSSSFNTSGEAVARGLKSLSTTMLEQMQTNADATLGFMRAMAGVKTLSEAIELQARHARQQFETVTAQAKALAGIVNKTASETTEPMRKALDASIRRAS
jgi:hypothetical protein